jgi:hypothetical protein
MSSFTLSTPDAPVNGPAKRPPIITVRRTPSGWLADMHQALPDVVALFGTQWLPTPFTDRMPAERVVAELERRPTP